MQDRRGMAQVAKHDGKGAKHGDWSFSMRGFLESQSEFIGFLDSVEKLVD